MCDDYSAILMIVNYQYQLRTHLQLATLESTKLFHEMFVVGIDGAGVNEGGNFVERTSRSQSAIILQTSQGSYEVHATLTVLTEKSVLGGNFDGQTVRMSGPWSRSVTAFGRFTRARVTCFST